MKRVGGFVSLVVGGMPVTGGVGKVEIASDEDALCEFFFHEARQSSKVSDSLVGGEVRVDVDVEDVKVLVGATGMEENRMKPAREVVVVADFKVEGANESLRDKY